MNLELLGQILTTVSVWAAPPLLTAVIWLVIRKFDDIDKTLTNMKNEMITTQKEFSDEIRDVKQDVSKSSHMVLNIQSSVNNEVTEIHKASAEIIMVSKEVRRWIEETRIDHGKILHIDSTVQRHEQILMMSSRVARAHGERLSDVEGKVIELFKSKKDKDDDNVGE